MKVEIPYDLIKTTIKELTDQINMEMEQEDPCPGVGVPADKQYPWYVELRNCLQEQFNKSIEDYNLGSKFAQHMYQRYLNSEIRSNDIVCPAGVSYAFQDGFHDCITTAEEVSEVVEGN